MKFFTIILVITFIKSSYLCCCNEPHEVPLDYYWRDYDGRIPHDAVPGGTNRAGNTTYVGQAWVQEWGLLPGTISPGNPEIRTLGGGRVYTTRTYIKILCSKTVNRIKWVPITSEQLSLLTRCHLISGGIENPSPLYIGRANHNGETVVGKVYTPLVQWKGVWVPQGESQVNYLSFEILTFDCDLHNYCINRKSSFSLIPES